ncbi:alpha-2-antiplasmin [Ascaphus truei]|uniref:alpha-2-antiplasmin n=1 Tax=Ascaphus truei TaxID=8439 RepID=UPI003F5A19C5
MEKLALICLLTVLPALCHTPVEINVEESIEVDTESQLGTTPYWTTSTKAPHSAVIDSTSDTWADIYPGQTTDSPATTTVTPSAHEATTGGCAYDSEVAPTGQSANEEHGPAETSDGEDECDADVSPEEMRRFAEAMMAFSIDLFKQVDRESKQPNVVVSPMSIALGLFQLSLGAGQETEKQLLKTLHVESMKCLHNKLKAVRKDLTQTVLKVATRMYIKKDFQVKNTFLEKSEKWYGSKPMKLVRSSEENLESVNTWISNATDGKIPHFLSQIPADLVLMLLNAIHFKGAWRNKFDPSMTVQDTFHINDQFTVPVDMMTAQKYPLSWFTLEHLDTRVARLPFKANMSFVVIMPNHFDLNISKILGNLNQTDLYSRFPREKPTLLRMPKLALDYKLELSPALTNLGLGQLFSNPDLGGISDEALFVSSVQHQSTLELNEEGVEASAATAVLMSRSLSTYSINRPFLFFLLEDTTGLPLFLGCVRDPSHGSPQKRKEQVHFPDLNYFKKGDLPK